MLISARDRVAKALLQCSLLAARYIGVILGSLRQRDFLLDCSWSSTWGVTQILNRGWRSSPAVMGGDSRVNLPKEILGFNVLVFAMGGGCAGPVLNVQVADRVVVS